MRSLWKSPPLRNPVAIELTENRSLDLRDPNKVWRQEHRERRRRECLKVEPAYPDWRREELREKYAPRDAYEPDEVTE